MWLLKFLENIFKMVKKNCFSIFCKLGLDLFFCFATVLFVCVPCYLLLFGSLLLLALVPAKNLPKANFQAFLPFFAHIFYYSKDFPLGEKESKSTHCGNDPIFAIKYIWIFTLKIKLKIPRFQYFSFNDWILGQKIIICPSV